MGCHNNLVQRLSGGESGNTLSNSRNKTLGALPWDLGGEGSPQLGSKQIKKRKMFLLEHFLKVPSGQIGSA
jgi:hypothetical protein